MVINYDIDTRSRLVTIKKLNMLYITSFRYCLGRRTYIVSDFSDNFIEDYKYLTTNTLNNIEHEIKNAFSLGDNCDKLKWENILKLIQIELKNREKLENE